MKFDSNIDVKTMFDTALTFVRDVFSGHIFNKDFFIKNLPLMLFIIFFLFIHVGLRYSCEKKIVEIEKARKELLDVKYDALTRSSQLLEMHKQSSIQDLVETKDPTLKPSNTPPLVIKK
jgi:hypothetical protein